MRSAFARLRRLPNDRSGNVVIYTAVAMSAMMGMVGLALDGSSFMISHSESEAAADAAALAAASQLDGSATAFQRAAAAAQGTLVRNDQRFASAGGATGGKVQISTIRFLKGLPADDSAPITAAYVAADTSEARYVEVTTQTVTHTNTFLRVVGSPNTMTLQATAVAGFNTSICKVAPLLLCNPADQASPGAAFTAADVIGKSYDLWAKLGGGDFALLEFPGCDGNTGKCYRDEMASAAPNGCFGPSVDTVQGNKVGNVEKGVNVRFGDGSSASEPSDTNIAEYPAASGQSAWDCPSYWSSHHTGTAPAACTAGTMSRYAMYDLEKTTPPTSAYTRSGATARADRRIMYVAVVNCKENGLSDDVPVEAYLKGLLLQPAVGTGSDKHVWLEAIDVVRPGPDEGVLRDDVQLYR